MDIKQQHWLETYKSMIALSVEGFKYLALINGGAVVVLLAYLGNIADKNLVRPDVRCAIFYFLSGLMFCGLALLFAYVTQLRLLNEYATELPLKKSHLLPLYLAALFYVGSLSSFCAGALSAVNALT